MIVWHYIHQFLVVCVCSSSWMPSSLSAISFKRNISHLLPESLRGTSLFCVPLHHFVTGWLVSASPHSKAAIHLQHWEACPLRQLSSLEDSDDVKEEQEGKGQRSLQFISSMQRMPVREEATLWEDRPIFGSSLPQRLHLLGKRCLEPAHPWTPYINVNQK